MSRTHDSVKQAILQTVLEVLPRIGYDRLTLDLVARRAEASKATIYRQWPGGKSELVRCAVTLHLAQAEFAPVEPTGDLRHDLMNMTRRVCAWMQYRYPLVVGLSALVDFHHQVFGPSREHARVECATSLQAIVMSVQSEVNSVHAGLDDVADTRLFAQAAALLHALAWDRLSAAAVLDDVFVEEAVDILLLPLLRTLPITSSPLRLKDCSFDDLNLAVGSVFEPTSSVETGEYGSPSEESAPEIGQNGPRAKKRRPRFVCAPEYSDLESPPIRVR